MTQEEADKGVPFYATKEGRVLMEQVWKICGYGTTNLTNPMAREIVTLFHQHLAEREKELKELYQFERNHHDTLKGIDNYNKFKSGEPNSPEHLAAWINQLSPWNLERGVEALRAHEKTIRLNERIEVALDNYRGHTFSDSTDYKGKFEKFTENNEKRLAQLSDTKAKEEE